MERTYSIDVKPPEQLAAREAEIQRIRAAAHVGERAPTEAEILSGNKYHCIDQPMRGPDGKALARTKEKP